MNTTVLAAPSAYIEVGGMRFHVTGVSQEAIDIAMILVGAAAAFFLIITGLGFLLI
jgi:hypothetical protein